MKKIIQFFCIILSVLSLLFFLYGSIKLSRIESGNYSQNIESGIPGVEMVQPSNLLTREGIQTIIALSVAGLVIGIVGYLITITIKPKPPGTEPFFKWVPVFYIPIPISFLPKPKDEPTTQNPGVKLTDYALQGIQEKAVIQNISASEYLEQLIRKHLEQKDDGD